MESIRPAMIACVSFETVQIVQPAIQYNAKRIYLFHYVRDKETETGRIYAEFYDEVCRLLREFVPGIDIIECSKTPLWEHSLLLRDITNVISANKRAYPKEPIYINISAGSDEFTSAGKIAALRCEGVENFTVSTKEFMVPLEKIREIFYHDGRPVGLTKECREAQLMPKYDALTFDELLIRSLRIFIEVVDSGEYRFAKVVVARLKEQGLWLGSPNCDIDVTFLRLYTRKWKKLGWVEKGPGKDQHYLPTARGREVAKIFYTD